MRPIRVTQNPAAQSAVVVAASQSPGAGAITLAATASAIDSAVGGRIVSLVSGGNDSGITFTITGLDQNGLAATEAVTGGNVATVVSTKFYSSVSSITHTGSVAGTFSSGTVNTTLSTDSPIILLDFYNRVAPTVAIQVTGTINFTVQETFDPVYPAGQPNLPSNQQPVTLSNPVWFSPTAFSAKSANAVAQLDIGATAMQIVINSYSTGATLTANIIHSLNGY